MAKSFKRRIRMERAVRLEALLYKDQEIADFLDMSPAGLAQMKMDPEYAAMRIQILTGVVTEEEKEFLKESEYKHEKLRDMVPQALQNLYDLARSKNESIKLKVSAEILDREGSMAKVSRIGLATSDQGGVGTLVDDEIASNLLNVAKVQKERAENEAKNAKISVPEGSTTIQ